MQQKLLTTSKKYSFYLKFDLLAISAADLFDKWDFKASVDDIITTLITLQHTLFL